MDCSDSNSFPSKELKRSNKDNQNYLSTNNESNNQNSISSTKPIANKLNIRIKKLIYYAESKNTYQIFGEIFVKKNKNNIDLIINNIIMIIKKELI